MISLSRILNLKVACRIQPLRHTSQYKTNMYKKSELLDGEDHLEQLIKKFAPRLIYNTIVEKKIIKNMYKLVKQPPQEDVADPIPLTLKYLSSEIQINEEELPQLPKNTENKAVNFPYDTGISVGTSEKTPVQQHSTVTPDVAATADEEVRKRHELQKEMKNWMFSYDNYDDYEDEDIVSEECQINYGTPDPKSKISNTPCGGCGALLHCKDTAIPGYIPSEIFKNSVLGKSSLEAIVCQRCHFLHHYNVALQVRVNPDDYPKVLATISQRQGMVILMVDLLDFPCSVWPGIGEIFGSGIPIVIVGNKVDLLPQDSKDYLQRIKNTLLDTVRAQGFASFNIKDVVLTSAKTGYGIEELITKLGALYKMRGDVYIVGCTNVGKSSLFNAFLQSDYCKTQALDLIQRATTSVWPGTTLNLLKFPIKRPRGYHQYLRHQRLMATQKLEVDERKFRKEQLRKTRDPKYATLMGYFDITKNPYTKPKEQPPRDVFIIQSKSNDSGMVKMGINERSPEFAESKWCYDTPGVVQPDQIIHLLTTEELLLTLPKQIILPRTFCVKPKSSLFIAGLARLDYTEGPGSVRLTVFASEALPITVCHTDDAEQLYDELLGTQLLKVPVGETDRLEKWPKLEFAKEFNVIGVSWKKSNTDVVLSNAGWIAITGLEEQRYHFHAWTPEKRGVHLRDCLLPHAVGLTGRRFKNSVAYDKFRFFLQG